jgi:YegS C-terminal NAD kinase beta sandwich-like domain
MQPWRGRGFERRRGEPAHAVIRKGVPWGHDAEGPADCEVAGDDAALAAAVTARPHSRVTFRPTDTSDFARAIGLSADAPRDVDASIELPCDLLRVHTDAGDATAVNMVVVGVAPDKQTWASRNVRVRVTIDGRLAHDGAAAAVVIANGQYLRGVDVVPRGHPGDGRAEVHVYALARSERRAMRERLPRGEQVPHPRITVTGGRGILVESLGAPIALEVDGISRDRAATVAVELIPGAFSLLL